GYYEWPGEPGHKGSGANPENGNGATVLRPAGDIVADRDRTFLAERDRPHPLRLDTTRDEIVAHRLRTPRAKRDVVFAGAAFVSMTLDGELAVLAVVGQPLRLLVQRRAGLRREFSRIGFEKHAVADIDDEVLLASGRCLAGGIRLRIFARPGAG